MKNLESVLEEAYSYHEKSQSTYGENIIAYAMMERGILKGAALAYGVKLSEVNTEYLRRFF